MKKNRLSNIELLRIIAMMMIVLLHMNYYSLGVVDAHLIDNNPFEAYVRMQFQQFCVCAVNVFVLISGWFGIKYSMKGVFSILFQFFFWGVGVLLFSTIMGRNITLHDWRSVFNINDSYWFIIAYIFLFLLAPSLNRFVELENKKVIAEVIVIFFLLEFLFGWQDKGQFLFGYSTISFCGLYLLARIYKLYINPKISNMEGFKYRKALFLSGFFLFSVIPVIIGFWGRSILDYDFVPLSYTSPFVILASSCLLLFFSEIELKSSLINWCGCSVLSIYLFHLHPVVIPYLKDNMFFLYAHNNGYMYIFFCLVITTIISFLCILLDKVRIFFWNKIIEKTNYL